MTESKQVTKVKRKTSEIPTRDEELHSKDNSFLRGGLQKWSKAERIQHRSFSLAFTKALTSHSPYYTKMDYILLEALLLSKWCVESGGVGCLL
jgi:hypothetical protein